MKECNLELKNIILGISTLVFAIFITIIISKLIAKYKKAYQEKSTLNRMPIISVNPSNLLYVLLFFTIYSFIFNVVDYFFFSLNYLNLFFVFIDLILCLFSSLLTLSLMVEKLQSKLVKMPDRIPKILRIITIILVLFISQIIHKNNIV